MDAAPERRWPRAARALGPIVLVATAFLFFGPALLGHRIFSFRDLELFDDPLHRYWVENLRLGHWPWLNAAVNGGQPIVGNPVYAVFYPGNVVYIGLPFDVAWNAILAGHVLWGALGAYWLSRLLGCGASPALTGALTFGFGGPTISALCYYNILIAGSWLPWVLGLALESWRHGGVATTLAALALASQLLAGEPSISLATATLLLAGFVAGLTASAGRGPRTARGISIAALALLLAAAQLVPAFEWLPHTRRGLGLDFRYSAAYFSLHPARLCELLVPHVYGDVCGRTRSDYWGGEWSDGGFPYVLKIYAGLTPLLLAPLAVRRRAGLAAAGVAAAGLLASMGRFLPGYHALWQTLPPLRIVRYPEKLTLVACLGFAMVASLGAEQHLRGDRPQRAIRAAFLVCFAVLAAAILAPHADLTSPQRRAQLLAAVPSVAVVLVVTGILALKAAALKRWLPLLLPLVVLGDLARVTWEIPDTRPASLERRTPALLEQVPLLGSSPILHLGEKQLDLYAHRLLEPSQAMHELVHPLTGLRFGVRYEGSEDTDRMAYLASASRAMELLGFPRAGAESTGFREGWESSRPLDSLRRAGVARIVSLVPLSHPELFLEGRIDAPRVLAAFVYRLVPPPPSEATWDGTSTGPELHELAPHRMRIDVDRPRGGPLTVRRNALPGWIARADGVPIPTRATAEGWMHLDLPAGTQAVELRYFPPGLAAGGALSLLGLLAAGIALVIGRRDRDRRDSSDAPPR